MANAASMVSEKSIHVKTIFKTKVSVDKIKNEKKKKKTEERGKRRSYKMISMLSFPHSLLTSLML